MFKTIQQLSLTPNANAQETYIILEKCFIKVQQTTLMKHKYCLL